MNLANRALEWLEKLPSKAKMGWSLNPFGVPVNRDYTYHYSAWSETYKQVYACLKKFKGQHQDLAYSEFCKRIHDPRYRAIWDSVLNTPDRAGAYDSGYGRKRYGKHTAGSYEEFLGQFKGTSSHPREAWYVDDKGLICYIRQKSLNPHKDHVYWRDYYEQQQAKRKGWFESKKDRLAFMHADYVFYVTHTNGYNFNREPDPNPIIKSHEVEKYTRNIPRIKERYRMTTRHSKQFGKSYHFNRTERETHWILELGERRKEMRMNDLLDFYSKRNIRVAVYRRTTYSSGYFNNEKTELLAKNF